MKYIAFVYQTRTKEPKETYGLMPLSRDCSIQSGYYNFETEELVLSSVNTVTNLEFVEKVDDFGKPKFNNKGDAFLERRNVVKPLEFRLSKGEKELFIIENVINKTLCLDIEAARRNDKKEAETKITENG